MQFQAGYVIQMLKPMHTATKDWREAREEGRRGGGEEERRGGGGEEKQLTASWSGVSTCTIFADASSNAILITQGRSFNASRFSGLDRRIVVQRNSVMCVGRFGIVHDEDSSFATKQTGATFFVVAGQCAQASSGLYALVEAC